MDLLLISVIAVIAIALIFDFTNGFHDAANSVATVVATRALPARWAPAFSAFFNFAAYFVVGTAVANTVAKTVKSEYGGVALAFAALFAAIAWNYVTWRFGMPSLLEPRDHRRPGRRGARGRRSGRHRLVERGEGGHRDHPVAGGRVRASPSWRCTWSSAFRSCPSGTTTTRCSRGSSWSRPPVSPSVTAPTTRRRRWASSPPCSWVRATPTSPTTGRRSVVPEWAALSAYAAIALGTLWGGWKIIETMGLRLTTLHANSGAAANIGATTAIFGATAIGMPISTTHAAASSIVGAGVGSGKGANWKVVGEMVLAWADHHPGCGDGRPTSCTG